MSRVTVLIASPLEAEYAERIARVSPAIELLYRPDLVGEPRYKGDHYTVPVRSARQEAEMRALLGRAEVLFDVDRANLDGLLALTPRLRWIQSTSSGVGELIARLRLDATDIILTNAAGIHATPLSEFCLMAMLMFVKRANHMLRLQREHRWERFHSTTLRGKTLGILGLGAIGRELARSATALGMEVHGVKVTLPADHAPEAFHVARLWPITQLHQLLPQLDFVVNCLPRTKATTGLFGRAEFALMRETAYFLNIGRGQTVDEAALIEVLQQNRIAGAALDVIAHEPLDPASPLWALPNVLISPHSASTVDTENEQLTDLFCDNVQRYLEQRPLRNVVDKHRGY